MDRKEVLVTKVKKVFLELLVKKEMRVYMVSQEIKVATSDQWPLVYH